MTTERRTQIAVFNAAKYNSLKLAQACADNSRYIVNILMGDNGQYWVAANAREESLLIKAGYEKA